MPIDSTKEFKPINISVLTVSDTRTEATDKSGQILAKKIKEKGHGLAHKQIVKDDKEEIKKFIVEHFTVSWEYWYRFQIPYLVRHRTHYGDLESWNVWGSIGLVQIRDLIESIENDVTRKPETYGDFFLATLKHNSKRGINPSSISDISENLDQSINFISSFSLGSLCFIFLDFFLSVIFFIFT